MLKDTPNVLFISAYIRSHLVPSFYLAERIAARYNISGANIHYASPGGLLDYLVRKQGYQPVRCETVRFAVGGERKLAREAGGGGRCIGTLLRLYAGNACYNQRKRELDRIMAEVQPSVVFIDIFSGTDFLLLYPYAAKVKLILFSPMLSIHKVGGFPQVFESQWNQGGESVLARIRGLGRGTKARKPFREELSERFGAAVATLQLWWTAWRTGLPWKHRVTRSNPFVTVFRDVPEIVLAPRELEFSPGVSGNFQHYLGLCVAPRQEVELDPHFQNEFSKLRQVRATEGKCIVYCAFGTYSTDPAEQKDVFYFILNLVEALEDLQDVRVVCAVGDLVMKALRVNNVEAPNFLFFSRVPQLEVLPWSDLFITHGGLNSVKEAVYYQVPMLVYPLDENFDQNGNGFKVAHHGLGLRGNLRQEEPDALRAKVTHLLSDQDCRRKIAAFSDTVRRKYDDAFTEDVLHRLLDTPNKY